MRFKNLIAVAILVFAMLAMFIGGFRTGRVYHEHEFQYICDRVEEDKWAVIEISCECGYHEMVDVEIHP